MVIQLPSQDRLPAGAEADDGPALPHELVALVLALLTLGLLLAAGASASPWLTKALLLLTVLLVAGAALLVHRTRRRDAGRRQRLRLEREQNEALWAASIDGLHMLDRDGGLVDFSDEFAALLRIDRASLIGAHVTRWERHYSPAQVDRVLRSFAVGQRLDFPSVFARGDGSRISVDVKACGVRVGGRDLLVLTARDVTEERRNLQQLRLQGTLQAHAARQAGIGAWELDPATGALVLTPEARRLIQLAPDAPDALRPCLRLLRPAARRSLWRAMAAAWTAGRPVEQVLAWGGPGEASRWISCTAERTRRPDGAPRLTGTLRDVTEAHRSAEALKQERSRRSLFEEQGRARDAVLRERDEMLDVLAHEVRQPLNNASAAMQAALSSLRDIGEHAAAPRLKRAQAVLGQVMARLDNTLAAATLLARHGPVGREEIDLDMLLAVAIADMPASDRTRIEVRRESSARSVSVDMGLMRLALRNLLSNALKYSRPDTPVVIRLVDSEQPLGLVFDVTDQGTGIEAGLHGHLFERGARGRQTQGAEHGLGLYIVRRVMELHGGQALLLRTGSSGTTMRLILAEAAED